MTTQQRTDKTPYDAEHVSIVHEAGRITALYIPDPQQAKNPKHVLDHITDRSQYEAVEIVAEAVRYYKSQGASFSGWVVSSGPDSYSEPISRKADAEHALNAVINTYFADRAPHDCDDQGHLRCSQYAAPQQHEVPEQLDDEDGWDEPRAELVGTELYLLRAGAVVEATTVQGTRCRIRLAAAPTHSTQGTAFLQGPSGKLYEVKVDTATLIGVMPREGDMIHARAKTHTTDADGKETTGLSKPILRRLDRAPWPGGEGQLVVSDGKGFETAMASTVTILAPNPTTLTDEQRIVRAVRLAMPKLDFRANTTSTSAICVYAKRAEHESRNDEAVLARNDDIADALVRCGFFIARRGVGQHVYAMAKLSSYAYSDGMCDAAAHRGERARWIAVIGTDKPFEDEYACRACVIRHVESKRAEQHIDPERPYILRMWDEQGRTLRVAPDASSLDFLSAETEQGARDLARGLFERGWMCPVQGGEPERVRAVRVTIDRGDFEKNGLLWKLRPVSVTGYKDLVASGALEPTEPRPGDQYRSKDVPGRVVEVESVLRHGANASIEFKIIERPNGLTPSGFPRSMSREQFLTTYEPATGPAEQTATVEVPASFAAYLDGTGVMAGHEDSDPLSLAVRKAYSGSQITGTRRVLIEVRSMATDFLEVAAAGEAEQEEIEGAQQLIHAINQAIGEMAASPSVSRLGDERGGK